MCCMCSAPDVPNIAMCLRQLSHPGRCIRAAQGAALRKDLHQSRVHVLCGHKPSLDLCSRQQQIQAVQAGFEEVS